MADKRSRSWHQLAHYYYSSPYEDDIFDKPVFQQINKAIEDKHYEQILFLAAIIMKQADDVFGHTIVYLENDSLNRLRATKMIILRQIVRHGGELEKLESGIRFLRSSSKQNLDQKGAHISHFDDIIASYQIGISQRKIIFERKIDEYVRVQHRLRTYDH